MDDIFDADTKTTLRREIKLLTQENEQLREQNEALKSQVLHESDQKENNIGALERDILREIFRLVEVYGKATTMQISKAVILSESQTWRYLRSLEKAGLIERIGQRGGWRLPDDSQGI